MIHSHKEYLRYKGHIYCECGFLMGDYIQSKKTKVTEGSS